jgi:hypothetical protein
MFFKGDEHVLLPLYHPEWPGMALFSNSMFYII